VIELIQPLFALENVLIVEMKDADAAGWSGETTTGYNLQKTQRKDGKREEQTSIPK